jgi:hypothetical protein
VVKAAEVDVELVVGVADGVFEHAAAVKAMRPKTATIDRRARPSTGQGPAIFSPVDPLA